MDISTTVIPGHRRQAAQSAALLAVNPESIREYRLAASWLDSGFKPEPVIGPRFCADPLALAPE
jgi:hypothetical protein